MLFGTCANVGFEGFDFSNRKTGCLVNHTVKYTVDKVSSINFTTVYMYVCKLQASIDIKLCKERNIAIANRSRLI